MKLFFAIAFLLLSACGKAPVGYENSNWERLDGLRRWEFAIGTVRDLKRELGQDWEEIGTYRYEADEHGFRFYTESGDIVVVQIVADSQDQFRIIKFGQVTSWLPATFRRVP